MDRGGQLAGADGLQGGMQAGRLDFDSHEVRVIERDGEPWWVAVDVCQVLGLGNAGQAVSRLDDDERSSITINDGTVGTSVRNVINESGLYTLIIRSSKPEAKRFKKWVTSVVLPTLRKTGAYSAAAPDDDDEKGTQIVRTLGEGQTLAVISESGLYSLILTSGTPLSTRSRVRSIDAISPTRRFTA